MRPLYNLEFPSQIKVRNVFSMCREVSMEDIRQHFGSWKFRSLGGIVLPRQWSILRFGMYSRRRSAYPTRTIISRIIKLRFRWFKWYVDEVKCRVWPQSLLDSGTINPIILHTLADTFLWAYLSPGRLLVSLTYGYKFCRCSTICSVRMIPHLSPVYLVDQYPPKRQTIGIMRCVSWEIKLYRWI